MPARSTIILAYVVLCLVWGTTWGAIRLGLEDIPPLTAVAARFLLAAVALLIVAAVRRQPLGRAPGEVRLWLWLSVFSFALPYSLVYWAEQWVPSGLTACLAATFPLFVAIYAHAALPGDRLTPRSILGTIGAFVGILVLFSDDLSALAAPSARRAAALLLLSPASSAAAYVATKRWGQGLSPISLAAMPNLLGAVWVGVLAAFVERGRTLHWTPLAIGSVAYLALIGTALTFTLWYWLLAQMPATRLATISFVVPILALGLGVVAFDEPLSARLLVGATMVLGSVAVTSVRR